MNNTLRVVYADDEETHHSLLTTPPTFLTPRREVSVWNLRRGGSGISPSSRNAHERTTRSGGVETPPPPTIVRSSSEFSAIVRAIGANFLFGKLINNGSLLRGQKGWYRTIVCSLYVLDKAFDLNKLFHNTSNEFLMSSLSICCISFG